MCGQELRPFVLTVSSSVSDAQRLLQAGVNGCCPRGESPEMLAFALRTVVDEHDSLPALLLAGAACFVPCSDPRTERQRQVLALLARGLSNKDIARLPGVAEWTVKLHVQSLPTLLGANNRTHAVARARQAGPLEPGTGAA